MTPLALRSLLYVPAHVEKLAPKAAATDADAVVLDLEDAVPLPQKAQARQMLPAACSLLQSARKTVAVRVNNDPALLQGDLGAAIAAKADIVILPKVETPDFVRESAAAIEDGQGNGPVLIALIESPRGLLNAPAIASAHQRLTALNLGTEDFCLEMGMTPEWDTLVNPSQQIVTAARAAGIVPLGYAGSIAEIRDADAFSKTAQRSARLGFEGGFAIHPSQIAPLNKAFSPDDAEIANAARIVQAYDKATEQGLGAASLDGKMIDLPVVGRARRVIAKAQSASC